MQNTIKILIDLKKEIYRFDKAQQGDDVILDITILENGSPKDLTNETVELIYINANNTVASIAGNSVVVNGNNVKITCPRDCTRSYGIAKFQLRITNTYQISTFPLALTIVPGVDQGQQISQNISTILEDLTAKNIECKETLDGLNEWVNTHGDIVAIDTRLNEAENKIAEHTSQLDKNINQTTNINDKIENKFDIKELLLVAHRGAESVAPQNTIPSTEYAGMMGYYGCECDVQVTSDKEWVLFHDDTLDALTDGTGTVASKTLAEIKALSIDYGPSITTIYTNTKIPTLREFLTVCSRWGLVPFIELKKFIYDDLPSLFSILNEFNMTEKAVIMSTISTLKYCKDNIKTNFRALTLINPTAQEINEVAANFPFSIVGIPHTNVNQAIVESITNANLQCAVWTNGIGFQLLEDDFKKWGVRYTIGGIV